jgi:hypothetical protein
MCSSPSRSRPGKTEKRRRREKKENKKIKTCFNQ